MNNKNMNIKIIFTILNYNSRNCLKKFKSMASKIIYRNSL